jgi:hypothetical protein
MVALIAGRPFDEKPVPMPHVPLGYNVASFHTVSLSSAWSEVHWYPKIFMVVLPKFEIENVADSLVDSPATPSEMPGYWITGGARDKNGASEISFPVKLTGMLATYPATPLTVCIVRGVETIPGVTLPKLAFTASETPVFVKFQVTGILKEIG